MRWSRLAMGFCPQFRSGRRLYAQETTGALLAGLFLWLMINPIADAEFISDEMLTWIGRFVYPLLLSLIHISRMDLRKGFNRESLPQTRAVHADRSA